MENPIKMDDLGGPPPYFWKQPFLCALPAMLVDFLLQLTADRTYTKIKKSGHDMSIAPRRHCVGRGVFPEAFMTNWKSLAETGTDCCCCF